MFRKSDFTEFDFSEVFDGNLHFATYADNARKTNEQEKSVSMRGG